MSPPVWWVRPQRMHCDRKKRMWLRLLPPCFWSVRARHKSRGHNQRNCRLRAGCNYTRYTWHLQSCYVQRWRARSGVRRNRAIVATTSDARCGPGALALRPDLRPAPAAIWRGNRAGRLQHGGAARRPLPRFPPSRGPAPSRRPPLLYKRNSPRFFFVFRRSLRCPRLLAVRPKARTSLM